MKKKFLTLSLLTSVLLPKVVHAEDNDVPKFGGYVIGKYAYNDDEAVNSTLGFSLRMFRLYVKGSALKDFNYFMQMEMSGAHDNNSGPRVLDAYGEWCKFDEFQVRIGQFNRSFAFEPAISPWNVGYGDYSQATLKLVGGIDRNGEYSSVTRDVGVQIQGDLLKNNNGSHSLLHYQIGMFNGQGINHSDLNSEKDIMGGVWISPIKDLRIGAFGWLGSYTKVLNGQKLTVDRNRMSFGIDYESDWVFRSEYIVSQGGKLSSILDYEYGASKSDAWYVTAGFPITKEFILYGKWDVYRDEQTPDSRISQYGLALNWWIHNNVMLQMSYAYVDSSIIFYTQNGKTVDRNPFTKKYNLLQLQAHYRF